MEKQYKKNLYFKCKLFFNNLLNDLLIRSYKSIKLIIKK